MNHEGLVRQKTRLGLCLAYKANTLGPGIYPPVYNVLASVFSGNRGFPRVVAPFMDFTGKTFLVVGASGALGSRIADRLATAGARVLGTARTPDSAGKIPASAGLRLVVDLDDQASIQVLADYLVGAEKLDGIVIAAGRVGFGRISDTRASDAARLMQLNHLGPASLITLLAPALNQGAVIGSITGVVAERTFPGIAAYCVSKSAHSVWLGALGSEWRRNGVSVLEFRPGHTETGLATRPLFGDAPNMPAGMEPDFVAEKIVVALATGNSLASTDFA